MILQRHILNHCMSSWVHFPVLSTKPLDLILTSSSALSLSFTVKLLEMIVSYQCFQFLSSHSHLNLLHQASLISMNLLLSASPKTSMADRMVSAQPLSDSAISNSVSSWSLTPPGFQNLHSPGFTPSQWSLLLVPPYLSTSTHRPAARFCTLFIYTSSLLTGCENLVLSSPSTQPVVSTQYVFVDVH